MALSTEQNARGGSGLWLLQVISGGLLIVLLGLHMVAHHFVVEGGLRDFTEVLEYVSNPLIFVLEILFLIVVSIHAMLGIRAILFDLNPGPKAVSAINVILTVVGAGMAGYGIWLAIALQSMIP